MRRTANSMMHRITKDTPEPQQRLRQLSDALMAHSGRWRQRPFTDPRVPWAAEAPDVAGWLAQREHAEIDALEAALYAGRQWPRAVPARLRQWRSEMESLVALPPVAPGDLSADPQLRFRVPGRKWQQLSGFLRTVLPDVSSDAARVVDWCAGKGHLGRTAGALTRLPVVLLERRGRLASQALQLARKPGVALSFVEADVLKPGGWSDELTRDAVVMGLHACGGLTDALLVAGARAGVATLAVAPCCYHKHHSEAQKLLPRSRVGRTHDVGLTHSALRLATADEVVAPGRLRRARRHDNARRLALDLLLREASGQDVYTPLGTFTPQEAAMGFRPFVDSVSERLGLTLPARWDEASIRAAGAERARKARGLGVVRALYRRALELWLVFDRAAWLEELGRPAEVRRFCAASVSPRNVVIVSRGASR